jgi:Flp pilus assembly protein TadG
MGPRDESGSAIVEFLLVSVLLVALTAGILQLVLALHVRNTLADAAAEGARQASLVGQTNQEGVRRTRDLIRLVVGMGDEADVVARRELWQGTPTVTVTVTAPLPLFGFFGPPNALRVVGRAPVEVLAGQR